MSSELFTGLLLNTGLLALCALSVTFLAAFYRMGVVESADLRKSTSRSYFGSMIGMVFGLTSGLLVIASVRVDTGGVMDLRAAPLILSGIIGGPVAAMIAATIGGLARLSVGGAFAWGGVLSMFIYAFAGMYIGRVLGVDLRKSSFASFKVLVLTGFIVTVCTLPAFFVDHDLQTSLGTMYFIFPMLLLQNPLGLLLLGAALIQSLRIISDQEKLRRLTQELENSNAHLSAENRRLLDFSAIAAHDLKAPVVRVGTLAEFLQEDLKETGHELPETVWEEIEFISEAASNMNRLIDDLAEYSLSQNKTTEAADFDPVPRLRDVVRHMSLPAEFEIRIADDLPKLHVPTTAFDIVMRNLISNAVRHHDRSKGLISIEAYVQDGVAMIEVTDDGPGVPEKWLDRIFRPMERLSPGTTQGSGLGLSFVSGQVSGWGGTVHAFSAGRRGLTVAVSARISENTPAPEGRTHTNARPPELSEGTQAA